MSEKGDDRVSAGKAAKRLGVSTGTLRRYTLEGVLEDRRSPGGRRIFRVGDLDALSRRRGHPALPLVGGVVLYGRVSSHRQRAEGDLDRQMVRLREAAGSGSWSESSPTLPRGCRTGARACGVRSLAGCTAPGQRRPVR
ncbi:MerR family DNA-binding transcriptional regulator [Streptomyces sp. NPDC005708]|uniref:MerR family DNA-binding transcriptional regulator n=1 Tax=Streptomyces sp. NPDC005708 TaxID=3154564 RepID=UPI0034057908